MSINWFFLARDKRSSPLSPMMIPLHLNGFPWWQHVCATRRAEIFLLSQWFVKFLSSSVWKRECALQIPFVLFPAFTLRFVALLWFALHGRASLFGFWRTLNINWHIIPSNWFNRLSWILTPTRDKPNPINKQSINGWKVLFLRI